jgi:hypothetical protein
MVPGSGDGLADALLDPAVARGVLTRVDPSDDALDVRRTLTSQHPDADTSKW